MREHADFAYFHADVTAKLVINTGYVGNYLIDDQTIVFADDSGKIYTHGGEFGGKQTTINKGKGILVSKSGSEYTLSLDTDWLTTWLSLNYRPNAGKYTAGYAININSNNVISVDRDALNIPEGNGGSGTGGSSGVTKEYVDGKVSELKGRLDNIVSEINWQSIFQQYGTSGGPNAGHTEDEIKGIIEQWVKSDDGTQIVWLQLTANDAHGKPAWVSVVAEKADQWITGTQIQQLQDLISLIAGNFDANGNPLEGKWSGIILTAKDEHGKSVIDLAADEVIARNTIIAPAVVATAINAEDITITSKLTATNAEIHGTIYANDGIFKNCAIYLNIGFVNTWEENKNFKMFDYNVETGEQDPIYYDIVILDRNIDVPYPVTIQLPTPGKNLGRVVKFINTTTRNGGIILQVFDTNYLNILNDNSADQDGQYDGFYDPYAYNKKVPYMHIEGYEYIELAAVETFERPGHSYRWVVVNKRLQTNYNE